ncbi:MAG: hypothetical protein NVSMB45_14600 [Ginsengibacter sp.]
MIGITSLLNAFRLNERKYVLGGGRQALFKKLEVLYVSVLKANPLTIEFH